VFVIHVGMGDEEINVHADIEEQLAAPKKP
jgi:hypothetical protein